jgi:hypothetical protein
MTRLLRVLLTLLLSLSGPAMGSNSDFGRYAVAANGTQTFRHYGCAEDAAKFEGGLRPGGYATHNQGRPMHGLTAQDRLALPHKAPPNAYYTI